jgi:hypothetical protein
MDMPATVESCAPQRAALQSAAANHLVLGTRGQRFFEFMDGQSLHSKIGEHYPLVAGFGKEPLPTGQKLPSVDSEELK